MEIKGSVTIDLDDYESLRVVSEEYSEIRQAITDCIYCFDNREYEKELAKIENGKDSITDDQVEDAIVEAAGKIVVEIRLERFLCMFSNYAYGTGENLDEILYYLKKRLNQGKEIKVKFKEG